ncbi:MAG: HypC/HybG/HupF family hydrogenase formation chaperone [Sideroxyarcus sp.]|nr:HypC/HybG/HupF family hydrogenase formation chaperone [Sideroxyarcus sp.]
MSFSIPAKVVRILDNEQALVDMAGERKVISMSLLDDAGEGDYVTVYAGFALKILDPFEAQQALAQLSELDDPDAGLV